MRKMQGVDLFNLKTIGQPIDTKTHFFFLETSISQEENSYKNELISIHKKTRERTLWGIEGTISGQLKLAPNQKWLSFLSKGANNKQQIYIMPISGGRAYAVTKETESISHYQWSSTGMSLYFETEVPENKEKSKFAEAYVTDKLGYQTDGSGLKIKNSQYLIKKIDVASEHTSILLESSHKRRLVYAAADESFFLLADDLSRDEWTYGKTVYYYDVREQEQRSLTSEYSKGSFSFVGVSPDGSKCLLVGNDFRYSFVTQSNLYVYYFATGELVCLTDDFDEEIGDAIISDTQQANRGVDCHWLSDEEILFPVTQKGKIVWFKQNLTMESRTGMACSGSYHFTDSALIDDEHLLVGYSTPSQPSVLAELSLDTGKVTDIYNPNTKWLADVTLSESQEFWFKSVDDWQIQGWYLPPVEADENHPAILYIHGGPQVCYGESFFHEMQVHAANGYGVILLNPRGGEGYGQEFVSSILGDYGNKDYQDLMNGMDYILAEHPEIDMSRIYAAGGSYGGFMTNWIVGHTNRFRAAVTQRSISNWVSFYGTSDVGPFFVEFQLKRDLSDVEDLWKMSPLAYVHHVKTPTLVLHSEEDLRCPLEQGQQFYIGLKKAGVPTKLVMYPESSHGLSRAGLPNLRIHRLMEIAKWFETH
ncbi:alpha/beta hydrolase family protein [Vagococcus vulneris]|uniref:Peptidase S9 prolyl oligopeptidase catalytic domain-containing protein n=1 Tax=Vagococcus vulneris TaxID=1977869 RepID=A0A430A0C9_9ENTE|nr:S9 family peptidase [Vagococcus vulneris]RST99765.1 hypothetical protein CBF37_03305 [Vagococcus vulneris]